MQPPATGIAKLNTLKQFRLLYMGQISLPFKEMSIFHGLQYTPVVALIYLKGLSSIAVSLTKLSTELSY